MAQQIKFRLTAAKVGVSAALLALIGGIAERVRSAPGVVHITPASSPGHFLKLGGLSQKVRTDFLKVEQKLIKLQDKWIKLDNALNNFEAKVGLKYLKIDDANSEFVKKDKWIKLDNALNNFEATVGLKYLKIDEAAKKYVKLLNFNEAVNKLHTADSQFLRIRTAQNEFVQGRGGVVSAATTALADGSVRKLLQTPDKALVITISGNADQMFLNIHNNTGELLPAVQTEDSGRPAQLNLKPGVTTIGLAPFNGIHQFQLQTFGDGSSQAAVTFILSSEPSFTDPNNAASVVGQMLIGLL